MKLKLRTARPEDMKQVMDLIRELADFEKQPDEVTIDAETLVKDGFGSDPAFHVIVAEAEDTLVGMALFYERYSTWKGRALHLEDLIVSEKLRGKGIGSALYAEVMKFAHEKGYKRVAWEVLDWNKGAIEFYEATGAKVFPDWRVAQMDAEGLKKYIESIS